MSGFRRDRVHVLAVAAFLLGSVLLLSCQPAQPVPLGTPKPAEKAAATATKPAEKPVRGGTLRLATTSEFGSLDPNTQTGQDGFYSLYEQLIEPDVDGNLTKDGLAKDWTIGGDGKTITFKLREGVKFHDGTSFDAAAVKSNVDRMKDPASKSPFAEYYALVSSVEAVDPLTVRFNLSQPDSWLLPRVTGGAGGLMVSPAAVKKYGQDYPRNPVGTGPFQFVEWKPGDRVTLKRFDGYWKKDKDGVQLPYLDGVVFQIITDATVAAANLRTGQLDLMGNQEGVPTEQRAAVKSDPNLAYDIRPVATGTGITINTKKAPFDNKAVRQAVELALDREGMVAALGEGVEFLATAIHPIDKAYDDPKLRFPTRDLAKAKAKMTEAGYPSGGLKVTYTSNNTPTGVKVAEIVKANLAEIGIDVAIEVVASAAWNTKVRIEWNYQIASSTTNIAVGDPGHYMGNQFHSKGSRNYFGPYVNAKVDEALDKARVTYDVKQKAALYQEVVRQLIDDAPFIPVYNVLGFAGMNKKVRNFHQVFDVFNRTRDVWLAP